MVQMVDIKSKSRICLEQHNRLWFLLLKLRAAIGQERASSPHHSASHARLLRWRKKFWHGSPAHLGARITSFLTHCSRTIFSLAAWLRGVHIIKQQHDTIHTISPPHLPCVCFVAKLAALPTLLHIAYRESLVSCLGSVLSRQLFSQSFECSDTSWGDNNMHACNITL